MREIKNSECLDGFGKFITAGRIRANVNQVDVARKLGISQSYYSYIENGQREVDLVMALNICSILDLDLRDFIGNYM